MTCCSSPRVDPETRAPPRRLISLDAVRGIASLIVVFSHCYLTIPEEPRSRFEAGLLWPKLLFLLHNGDGAVMIFFVLSGYVLALPFFRGTQPTYARYVLKRLCRIYMLLRHRSSSPPVFMALPAGRQSPPQAIGSIPFGLRRGRAVPFLPDIS